MFTGIITDIGTVRSVQPVGEGMDMRIAIATAWPDAAQIGIGASVACAGCCLTVVSASEGQLAFEASAETLSCTALGGWHSGTRVNLERALRAGDEMGGHLVSGHVDGLAIVQTRTTEHGSTRFVLRAPEGLGRYLAPKGSVALDGVSLTVNEVRDADQGTMFGVNIIPHTLATTTWGLVQPGQPVHIEIDMLARYVARLDVRRSDQGEAR